ncbi:tumor necrosis factor receptor superfamily member 26 isoform X1 [Epinephelus fuscoguttatus]|uniref:tumor necrosis factor receptor superfamily member 26 isoform X1 n=1 Tax=Epinephelus fuscoguttatus TaxID=293821 RepID=UPI0020D06C5C|nr:tumor necrosis factor receptor superfamily member 26 isoform X1 [Epinephelus fuscoguttatus]
MGADSTKFPAWFFTFNVILLCVSASLSSAQLTTGSRTCNDGTYEHNGRICCLCGAGLYLEQHCTMNLQVGICKTCDPGTYNSQPNSQRSCEPCTSCTQPNANLEVDERCTPARDTKCRCKKDHYCSSGPETCRICYPCKECGPKGVKVACTARNDTVCNEKTDGGDNTGMIVGIVGAVLAVLVLGLGLAAYCWKIRNGRKRQPITEREMNGNARDVEMQPLAVPVLDLQPHLHKLAEVIGWKDMHYVATQSHITPAVIQSCQLDHIRSQDQTYQLLEIWVEKQGRNASKKLVEILQKGDKKGAVDRVMEILSRENPSA